jgi:tripartite-type tricarboxylate transporter receptor subunit TctC
MSDDVFKPSRSRSLNASCRRVWLQGAGLALTASLTGVGFAQASKSYPERAVRVLVPFPPGALTDGIGRLVADQLQSRWGQPFVVENRPGAGTLLAASVVAKSPADGHALMIATTTTLCISPVLFKNPLTTAQDFAPVATVGTVSLYLVARADFPANTLREWLEALRLKPGAYSFGSPSNGTAHHLMIEMIKSREKLRAMHVPYQGSIPALSDMLAGRIDFMFLDATVALPQIRAGKIKALAVNGTQRAEALPEVPAVAEILPYMDVQIWQTVVAPAGTPAAVVEQLNEVINKSLLTPEVRQKLRQMGVEVSVNSPREFQELIRRDQAFWSEVVHNSGARTD